MVAGGTTATAAEPSLTRKAVLGVLVIGGAGVVGEILKGLGPLSWLGGLISFLAWTAMLVAATFGGGALLA